MNPPYQYRAKVVRVVDGDTVILSVDLGFRVQHEISVRLARINAPERGQDGLDRAKLALCEILHEGAEVFLTTKKGDRYGRWIGEISTEGENVSDLLLADGVVAIYQPS